LKPAVPYLILAVVCALYLYPFVRGFNDAPDSGIYLNGADLVSQGAVPSRDFVELQGPGSFVWLALFFRLFGTSFETARVVLDSTGAALGLLAFWLSRRLGATGFFAALFVVMTAIPVLPMNSPHYDSNLFGLAALAVFLVFWDGGADTRVCRVETFSTLLAGQSEKRRDESRRCKHECLRHAWLALSAALCGLTTWTLQQKGVYLAFAFLACLLWRRFFRAGLVFAAAYAATVAVGFSAFAALPDAWYANFIWPFSSYSQTNAAPYGFPLWQNMSTILAQQHYKPAAWLEDVALSMPFLLVAALPVLLPLSARVTRHALPYWLAAYAFWLAELHRADMGHLRNGVILMAVLFFTVCETSGNAFLRRAGLVIGICTALSGVSHFLTSFEGQMRMTRRGAVSLSGDPALLDFLDSHTRPGEEVFVYPYQPIYYFAEHLRNPTRYSNLMYGINTNAQFQEATADLEAKKVRYLVFDGFLSGAQLSRVFPAYRPPAESQLIMEPYLRAHYRVVKDLGRFQIWERFR